MKLSYRAKILLAIIREYTVWDNNGELERFWIPSANQHCELTRDTVTASGAGDVQVLKGLVNKRLIERVPNDCNAYWYAVTEEGAVYYENTLWPEFQPVRDRRSEKAREEE